MTDPAIEKTIRDMARAARKASKKAASLSAARKNAVLDHVADRLEAKSELLFAENKKDLEAARAAGLSEAMLDRLALGPATIASMAGGLREVARFSDPVGATESAQLRPNGLEVKRVRVPLGVVGIIYESRPNVTVDAAGLCLKAGNAVILRGGSEAIHSNRALSDIIREVLRENDLPRDLVQVVPFTDRAGVMALLAQDESIDLIIPRGGEGLIRFVAEHSKIPVLKHYKGVCHLYVDKGANLDMAHEICFNAKVQRPGVCNALETLLLHEDVAQAFFAKAARPLMDAGVTLRGCPKTVALVPRAELADESDWPAEYLNLTLAVKVVPDMDAAMDHIAAYGSNHTEAIVTNDFNRAQRFVREVDASAVMVNASTRFNDGGQLGLGAEIGISTTKLHAYGPMGVKELTTTKFVVTGAGHVRTA